MSSVAVVVPAGIDDPRRPSGGNAYDRHVCRGLARQGWSVQQHPVAGEWPDPDTTARADLGDVLAGVADGGLALVDGLIASSTPEVVVPQADRLRLVVLLHMPLGETSPHARGPERAVLCAAAAVVTTSEWTRGWLIDRYALPADRVQVAEPGVERSRLAEGTSSGGELLCVGTVTPAKGHDMLVDALDQVRDVPWRCTCVGALDLDVGFVDRLRVHLKDVRLTDRVRFTGPLPEPDLDAAYLGADVLVSASRRESYGMVVTEALAHGLPVIAAGTGGVPEALGRGDGRRPGLLVPPDAPRGLAAALRSWLDDPGLRERLRRTATDRRHTLPDWSQTSLRISHVLTEVAVRPAQ